MFHSPVGFAVVLEVVHVAAGGGVLGVLGLPPLGVGDQQQVSVVLHHVLPLLEAPRGEHPPALLLDLLHLGTRDTQHRSTWSTVKHNTIQVHTEHSVHHDAQHNTGQHGAQCSTTQYRSIRSTMMHNTTQVNMEHRDAQHNNKIVLI